MKLIHGDCLEEMKMMEEGIIDLTVTSPPYDNLRTYNNSLKWGEHIWKSIIQELYRATKEGGVAVWVVGDATIKGSETGTSFKQALWAMECGFNLHDTMIYQKDNPPPIGGSNRYYQHFEYMFIFSKGKPEAFNPIKTERRNEWNDKRTHRTKGFTRNKDGEFVKKRVKLNTIVKIGNIWKYVVGGGNSVDYGTKHPAGFPEKLVTEHIASWSNKGDIVFDPFMGSGTTGKMAKLAGRDFIGIEKDADYYNIACKRIDEAGKQKSLF